MRHGEGDGFERFVAEVEPRLRQALVALCGPERARDALQEALLHAWRHWDRVGAMANPAGYLYTVARSRIAWPRRLPARLPTVRSGRMPEVEPGLPKALARLSERQRVVVLLAIGCEWSLAEVAALLGLSVSSVRNHLARGLGRLRSQLGVTVDG